MKQIKVFRLRVWFHQVLTPTFIKNISRTDLKQNEPGVSKLPACFFMIFQKQLYKNMPDTDINNFVKAFSIKYNSVILLHPHVLLNKKPWSRTFLSFKTVKKHIKKIWEWYKSENFARLPKLNLKVIVNLKLRGENIYIFIMQSCDFLANLYGSSTSN